MRPRLLITFAALTALLGAGSVAAAHATTAPAANAAPFEAGAAIGDFTPPAFGKLGTPDPADCIAGTPLEQVYDGYRPFAFEEPYIDLHHDRHYDFGDPFVDCNLDGRWDGNLIGGGTNNPRFYEHVADEVTARALAVRANGQTIVVEVLDQEGLFDTYQNDIRAMAAQALITNGVTPDDIFVSATHDESAPDSLGLGGVNQVTSGVNEYEVAYMIEKSADAIEQAVANLEPAHIRFAQAIEPANLRQCWSSYPFVDDQLMPTLQAVADDGATIATLTSVSQHTETTGFNPNPVQSQWLSADWPNFFRNRLQQRYGGVGIEMAGSVGSNETPEVFNEAISRAPQREQDANHPAGCRTLFDANGTQVPTGYYTETTQLGDDLANAVINSLTTNAQWSTTNVIDGARANVCLPLTNNLFLVAAVAGVFSSRPAYVDNCTVGVPSLPQGTTVGEQLETQVAAYRIGDGSFISVPGEVFPITYLGGFLGPDDFPYPQSQMTPMLMPYLHTPYRFIDGLAEDMVGYIFPEGNGVGVPGEHGLGNELGQTDTDRFGCGHSDDSESVGSQTGNLLGSALVTLLTQQNGPPEQSVTGRYVLPGGALSRDPLGGPSPRCNVKQALAPTRAVAIWIASNHQTIVPAAWMDLGGRGQRVPDRNTRGWIDARGVRHWLDVYPDVS